jgi:hypothetical protein
MVAETYLLKRIEMLQDELESLKRAILKKQTGKSPRLRGIWKGIDFSDTEIEKAKSSWLKERQAGSSGVPN